MALKRSIFTLLCGLVWCSAFSSSSFATITINWRADRLDNGSGIAISSNSLVLLVADTANNGFGSGLNPGSITLNSFLAGTDDKIIYRTDLFNGGDGVLFDQPVLSLDVDWTVGDRLALYWFPTLTASSTAVTAGTSFGSFLTGNVDAFNGSAAWVTPANGSLVNLFFYTADGTTLGPGSHSASSGNATQSVVPEPSVSLLLAMSGVVLVALRRRR